MEKIILNLFLNRVESMKKSPSSLPKKLVVLVGESMSTAFMQLLLDSPLQLQKKLGLTTLMMQKTY